jgi:tetratricopeptide (TPR) repeat protein
LLKVFPDHLLAQLGKGNALAGMGKLDEAASVFRKVLDRYPDNKFAITEMAIIKYNRGELTQAEEDFKKAIQLDGETYTCPYEGLGLVYLKLGMTDKAKESLKKAIEINPEIEYKKFNALARIDIKEGKYDEARKLLESSMKNWPYDDEARQLMDDIGKIEGGSPANRSEAVLP